MQSDKYMARNSVGIDVKTTGKRIKRLCEERGVTVKDIQEELNIGAFQSIYNWFSGKTLPSLDNMYRLSKMLNVAMEDIIVDNSNRIIIDFEFWKKRMPKYLVVYYDSMRRA